MFSWKSQDRPFRPQELWPQDLAKQTLCLQKRMHLAQTAFALLVLLGYSNTIQSAVAFSLPSFLRHKTIRSSESISLHSPRTTSGTQLRVSSTEPASVTDMKGGIGGRLEDAFASSKERGEAAFVTFVTAGYPRAEGKTKVEDFIMAR